jgi:electron-transferring-flavoprotein dehydrogenase
MTEQSPPVDRQTMDVDIACVGFGPAMGGFLTTLTRGLTNEDGTPAVESKTMPGMPPQIMCYERADDVGFGVSGVVTRGQAIRESLPDLKPADIPMMADVSNEKVVYLMDPIGASRRPLPMKLADAVLKPLCRKSLAFELPYIPPFLQKEPGWVFSIGQFTQWVSSNVMGTGLVQIWPGTPVQEALIDNDTVTGIRLLDQGVDRKGKPADGFMPGMDIKAALTVVGDGPVGAIGMQLDDTFGLPEGNHQREWALGMKMVIDLPEEGDGDTLEPGTVIHTLGYPEPEIFGFFYVMPGNVVSAGIFVPSWFDNPSRTAYRYLQHWMQHPYLWRYLKGGKLRSWGAKSLAESGKTGEPHLVGNGYARIGEGSGSTNVLTNSGVDEAWGTGSQLAEGVLELLKAGKPFTRENLEDAYISRRRKSWIEKEAVIGQKARDGFHHGVVQGLIGTALTGLTGGMLSWPAASKRPQDRIPSYEDYYADRISPEEIEKIRETCAAKGESFHDVLMNRVGWPEIEYDGELLMLQQDALLLGGKVQAPGGYADHVIFKDELLCCECGEKICIEMCSGQAIAMNPQKGAPLFDREKCVHCGACLWNCAQSDPKNPERTNIAFVSGAGGFHSAEN